MRKFYQLSLTVLFVLTSATLFAQNNFFADQGANRLVPTLGQREILPSKFRTYSTNTENLKSFLFALPKEASIRANYRQAPVMRIPMPDGTTARFYVWESPIQAPGLQAKFPDIRTFAGQGIDDPYATIRFDYSPYRGFHGQILSVVNGRIYIDPYARGDIKNYVSYNVKDYSRSVEFICGVPDAPGGAARTAAGPCRGTDMFTYRLAVACTNEYAAAVGGTTDALLHAAIVTAVNRVTGVYETELAVRLELIPNNDLIEFTTAEPDPFTGNNNAGVLINQSQTQITTIIGSANFDIGHTFSTGAGGLAGLGVVCNTNNKARGVTGLSNPTGDVFYIDFVAHEIGHQFGGNHSFNGQTGNCSGANRNGSTAYEPGSGTTIQAYAGICGSDDIQPNSDAFFHTVSFDEISNFITTGGGSACEVSSPSLNLIPVITAMNNNGANIPLNTPFTLNGEAMDPDGDPITYCWEQWDLGPQGPWNSGGTSTTAPNFKSRVPKTTGSRTFPDIAVILAGFPVNPPATLGGLKGETLPTVARVMKFRLTVRDNRVVGGGVVTGGDGCGSFTSQFQVNAITGTGPFAVSSPNGGESYPAGSSQTVTWNMAGSNLAPINTAFVNILLSTDGGLTFPTTVLAGTPNDGSESVTIPSVPATTTARIKIEAVDNIFFDISNANFSITAAPGGFTFNSPGPIVSACPASNPQTATLTATYNGAFNNPINLSSAVSPAGPTVTFGTNPLTTGTPSTTVNITNASSLAPGNYTVTVTGTATGATTQVRDIVFTINPGTGPAITGHPGNQTICNGANTSFTVTSPTATSIKWQVNTGAGFADVVDGGVYSGAATATLSLTGVPAGFNGYLYRAIASVLCGSTTSNNATLTVNSAASITGHPADITLCAGSNHTFSVTATGTGLTYLWYLSTDGVNYNPLADGGVYSGTATANLVITGITAGMSGNRYRVVVTGTGACPAPVTSNPALLTVITSVSITDQPDDITVCAGANASFTVAGSGTGIIYQWQYNTGSGFVNVPAAAPYTGTTSATLNITGATVSMSGYQYRALLSNSTCTSPGTSNAATLTVNSLPAITTNPSNSTICLNGTTSFTAAGTGTGITYQWQVNTGSGFANVINGGVYSGATTQTLTITGATAAMNGYQYQVVVTGTCLPAATSTAATLTVINPVAIAAGGHPAPAVICSGGNATFTVTGTSTQTINYVWEVSTNGGGAWSTVTNGGVYSGANTATLTITNAPLSMNSYLYRAQLSNSACTSPTQSNSALLTVRQLPTVGLTASMLALLPGQLSTLTATPSAPAVGGTQTMTWLYNGVPSVPPIVGNTYVANVQQVGTYQVLIAESYTGPVLVCSNSSPIVTITATASSRLFIFPSPNDGRFTVSYFNSAGTATKRTIAIFDNKGSLIYNKQFNITGAYTLIPIDLRQVNRGIYYVVVGDVNGNKLAEGKVHIR